MTLEVPLLAIPRNAAEPNPATIYAETYEWTIPSGWRWPDGTASTGAPRQFNARSTSSPNRLRVTPPGTTCGTGGLSVRVRAIDTECASGAQAGYTPTRSAERTLPINCVLPTLRIASNNAPAVVRCGDVRDYNFRADTQGGQPGGTFTYEWTATNNWRVPNPTAQVPGILPSGNSSTTLTLRGTYSRSGITAQLTPAQLAIGYNNQAEAPVLDIPNGFLLCYGQSVRVTPSGNPGTQYQWEADPAANLSISPNPSVQGQTVTVTALTSGSNPAYQGAVRVRVRAGNNGLNCAQSDPTDLRFVLYRAPLTYANNPIRLQVGSDPGTGYDPAGSGAGPTYQPVQCNQAVWLRLYGNLQDFYGNPLTSFRWNVDGQEPANSANQTSVLVPIRQGQVCVVVTNQCGQAEYYCWQVPVTGECGGGGGPVGDEPCVECRSAATAAYPNPADDELWVQPQGKALTLYNTHGKPVLRQSVQGRKAIRLATGQLPAGIYYLDLGNGQRQRIQVAH